MARYKQGDVLRSRTLGIVIVLDVVKDDSVEGLAQYKVLQPLPSGEHVVVFGKDLLVDATVDTSSIPRSIPFARYKVDPEIRKADMAQGVATPETSVRSGYRYDKTVQVEEDNYVRNPTRTPINSLVTVDDAGGEGRARTYKLDLRDSASSFETLYVVNQSGEILVATRPLEVRLPHPTLVEVPDPEVLAGGLMKIREGLLLKVDLASGHFKPGMMAMEATLRAFSRLPDTVFHAMFEGFEPYGAPALQPDFAQARRKKKQAQDEAKAAEKREASLARMDADKRKEAQAKIEQRARARLPVEPTPIEEFGEWMRGALVGAKSLL